MAIEITVKKVKNDYKRAKAFDSKWEKAADNDLLFALGEQWEDKDKDTVTKTGRPCLTLNIIQALIFLVAGYQRQARTSIRAFPEGGEDAVASEVVTRLLKNVMKRSRYGLKESEAFENSITIGKGFLEPFIDYSEDLINGRLNWVAADPYQWRIDPKSTEYDLSDARFCVKRSLRTLDELLELFPDENKEKKIRSAEKYNSGASKTADESTLLEKGEDYPSASGIEKQGHTIDVFGDDNISSDDDDDEVDNEDEYELFEYYYKKYETKYLAVDIDSDMAQIFDTKEEGEEWLANIRIQNTIQGLGVNDEVVEGRSGVSKIHTPAIYLCSIVGDQIIEDAQAPTFPRWKSYPLIPLFAHYMPLAKKRVKRSDLAYQGIVRSLIDPQIEKNKRRSQALHIINSVANAGWIFEEGAWVNPDMAKKFGTTPGVHLEYKKGSPAPQRIESVSVPQGHFLAESEAENDIKKISGINADLLAQDQGTDSGRAIALRQQQGMIMLKRIFDNLAWTHEISGSFILSQLPDLFTADKAMKVLGSEFIMDTFREGEADTPQLIMARAQERISKILSDEEIAKFDVAIGEGLETPTARYATYSMLMDLNEKVPNSVPPDVLMDYSDLPADAKSKVSKSIQDAMAMQEAQRNQINMPGGPGKANRPA